MRVARARFALVLAPVLAACPSVPPPESPPAPVRALADASAPAPGDASAPIDAAPPTPQAAFDGSEIDRAVAASLADHKLPGCVVIVGSRDRILFRRAYGERSVEPTHEPMDEGTMFDLASLTKTIATATSLFVLVERGRIDLDAPVASVLPAFGGRGKSTITVRQLLLHTSGLPPITPRSDYARGIGDAIAKIGATPTSAAPGARFRYSDVGYVVLGELVAQLAGKPLDVFAREEVFAPLGMTATFRPPPELRARIAPTEKRDGVMLRGEVHDPISAALGGVAGNAGLFATADDVARFARMILGRGAVDGHRILAEGTVRRMLAVHDVPNGLRALGWDVKSGLSHNRSPRFSMHAVGHGGYTGTSLWIDPARDLFVVFLSNRVHPDGKGAINPLASAVGTAAVAAADKLAERGPEAPLECPVPPAKVNVGIDVLAREGFRRLGSGAVALLSNAGARAADGRTTFQVLREGLGSRLALLFVPEHGFGADLEGRIADGALDGVPVKSLYGARFAPDDHALDGVDTVVVDLPDVGARFFTYGATLHRLLRAASAQGKRVVVLDRPNPLGGADVEGPLEVPPGSFVQHHPIPILHGLTLGELGIMLDADEHLGAAFDVVPTTGWARGTAFDATGLAWTPPSPNLRTFGAALAYGATSLVEATNVSVGRGTPEAFTVVGAPWLKPAAVIRALGETPGATFAATTVTPTVGPYSGTKVPAIALSITDRAEYRPVRVGLAVAAALAATHPNDWDTKHLGDMIGTSLADLVRKGTPAAALEASYREALSAFVAKRDKYLLYRPCVTQLAAAP